MPPTDAQLIAACRRGEATAWETLVNRYQRLVYTVPRQAGLDEDQSADVFQRVFTLLFENLAKLEQPDRLRAWLVTTARREAGRARQRIRVNDISLDNADEDGPFREWADDAPLPDERIAQIETRHQVRQAVTELDERCRRLLTLLFYTATPPPYPDIAAQLNMTEGSIGPTRARCLQKLRRLLDDD